jgi:hypothetical protein
MSSTVTDSSSSISQFNDGEHRSDGTIGESSVKSFTGVGENGPRKGATFQHVS